jgi:hypothetical protein
MTTVFKGSFEPNDMFFVIGVSLFQFIENLDLLQPSTIPKAMACQSKGGNWDTCSSHGFLAPDDFDGYFSTSIPNFPLQDTSSDDVCEHPFAQRRENLITATVKLFPKNHAVITFGVSSGVKCGSRYERRGAWFLFG